MFSPAVTSFFQLTPSFQSFPLKLTGISLNARDNMCYSTNVFPHTAAAAVAVAVAAYTSLNPFHSSKLNRQHQVSDAIYGAPMQLHRNIECEN